MSSAFRTSSLVASTTCSASLVEAVDVGCGVALQADGLHVVLGLVEVRPPVGDVGEEVVGEPLAGVVGRRERPSEAAHVAGGAGRHGHVGGRERSRGRRPGSSSRAGRGRGRRASTRCRSRSASGRAPCGTGRRSAGSRARATDEACRAWHAVQVPIEPSAFGLPTSWHFWQPLVIAAGPSSCARAFAGRSTQPGWYSSAKATCSAEKSFAPATAAQDGAAWRLRRYWSYCVLWQLGAVGRGHAPWRSRTPGAAASPGLDDAGGSRGR